MLFFLPNHDDTPARGVVVCTFAIGPDFANGKGGTMRLSHRYYYYYYSYYYRRHVSPDERDKEDEGKDGMMTCQSVREYLKVYPPNVVKR